MPTAPPTFRPAGSAPRPEALRNYDRERRIVSATRRLYSTARWQALRRAHLAAEPLCRMCLASDHVELATVCDHVHPHRGDVAMFWAGPFQSLCTTHHNSAKQSAERASPAPPPKAG